MSFVLICLALLFFFLFLDAALRQVPWGDPDYFMPLVGMIASSSLAWALWPK
jgi:hypothetical protein